MNLRAIAIVIVLAVAALGYVAWKKNSAPEPAAAPEAAGQMPPGGGMPPGGDAQATAPDPGVSWQVPKRWVEQLAGGMRLATYVVPAAKSGGDDGECAVYYFGPGQGGGVEPNIERWVGEFENPGTPKRATSESHGLKVYRVQVAGKYLSHGMNPGEAAGPREGWALLGAIVEGPNGSIFFKLTGPAATIGGAEREFDGMLGSMTAK